MSLRLRLSLLFMAALFGATAMWSRAMACCAVSESGQPVVNADQTVIILWDAATKMQHFIRQASFETEAEEFGFLVPSPSKPELEESGNEAFTFLANITAPEVIKQKRTSPGLGCGCGCSDTKNAAKFDKSKAPDEVRVLAEKQVAGFDTVVLEADSEKVLVEWLKKNGFAYSPEVAAWAKPYVEQGWKFTALKLAKDKSEPKKSSVSAAALRISFETDRPLFPYREPDSGESAETLGADGRLLRIFFLGDARYQGELTKEQAWSGQVAWAGKLDEADRKKILGHLNLPETTAPAGWWLTEFEDNWPYKIAPADVYFAQGQYQISVKRPPIIEYVSTDVPSDGGLYAVAAAVALPWYWHRRRRRKAA